MLGSRHAIVKTPTQEEYDKLISFLKEYCNKSHVFSGKVWLDERVDTCVRISHYGHEWTFGSFDSSYYLHREGKDFYNEALPEFRMCSVDGFIALCSGVSDINIKNETLLSLL